MRRVVTRFASSVPRSGPGLRDFLNKSVASNSAGALGGDASDAPYLTPTPARPRRVFFETYGCQMNVSDTEVAWALLQAAGHTRALSVAEADVALLVTCAIRENAESKVFKRLEELAAYNRSRRQAGGTRDRLQVGVLGCMAERLKTTLLDMKLGVDFVVGPDAYRDLPHMVASGDGAPQINVLLSFDETYADVTPVRLTPGQPAAFLSVMRGCDNMCAYCIVPFTRGRERSRPFASILDEVRQLADQGVREVTLLGQNVNSYRDTSVGPGVPLAVAPLTRGFNTLYKPRLTGQRFADLLLAVSEVAPRSMRIRFTSPHPKDFPDELLQVVRDQPNVCKQLHLPAQSGSSAVLTAMRRGYTREAYLGLIEHARATIPGVALSSDFIAGFCGETEGDHAATLSLLAAVQYDAAFLFAYSMRGKTFAHHRLNDDVPPATKQRRLAELVAAFQAGAARANAQRVGQRHIVLVEGPSKRDAAQWVGRTDGNMAAVFSHVPLLTAGGGGARREVRVGDFVEMEVTASTARTLLGTAVQLHNTLPS